MKIWIRVVVAMLGISSFASFLLTRPSYVAPIRLDGCQVFAVMFDAFSIPWADLFFAFSIPWADLFGAFSIPCAGLFGAFSIPCADHFMPLAYPVRTPCFRGNLAYFYDDVSAFSWPFNFISSYSYD